MMRQVLFTIQNTMNMLESNVYFSTLLKLFLVMYAGMAAPKLPSVVANLFDYNIFKVFILFLVLATSKFDVGLSIMIAVAFFVSMTTLNKYQTIDKLMAYPKELAGRAKEVISDVVSDVSDDVRDVYEDVEEATMSGYEKIKGAVY